MSPKYISTTTSPHLTFTLASPTLEYRFHVGPSGDLVSDHYGSPTIGGRESPQPPAVHTGGWGGPLNEARREFPDHGRGDFRLPAIRVRHGKGRGVTMTKFAYASHDIVQGKPKIEGLPSTFAADDEVETLIVTLKDETAQLSVDLRYSIFPKVNTITRSFTITNHGTHEATIERAASFSTDMEEKDWAMVYLAGDWTREGVQHRRKIEHGTQGFQSSSGYSSHYHNPFVALVPPTTTDHVGEAYGFSFIWSGSFSIDIEKSPANDRTRVLVGLNPLHLDWPLAPSATFTSPEVATVYEPVAGLGGMSRSYHKLYRNHLSRSSWTHKERPVLINNWEATYFDFTADTLTAFAKRAAGLGIRMFVMDDGWFGDKKPRVNDDAGLGDWVPNPKRFPQGLDPFVQGITKLQTGADHAMRFGIWVEPEMVNPTSELFDAHPDWAMQVQGYDLTEQRQQLVLDLSKVEVQDYIISSMSTLLSSSAISYVKWDNNRGIHEVPSSATAHAYILGLYRVIDTLCTRFPDVLFEGCASGGGRFDPGLLHYWCQSWTSDDSDALERLPIQFGTSLVYPPSSMGCHVSACPNEQVHRTTPLAFRAHVAMMGGSFGFELDLAHLSADEQAAIPGIVDLAERVNPYVIHGDMYRLADPQNNNWPAVMYTNKGDAVVLAYQIRMVPRGHPPALRLQGLEADATYELRQEGEDKVEQVKGAALMAQGIWADWRGDYASHVFWLKRVEGKANGAQ